MRVLVEIRKHLATAGRVFTLDVAFTANRDFIVLFGPSGSGKSLTLKALAGLLQPDAGRIVVGEQVFFDGDQRLHIPARRRRVGYVPQDFALFPT